MTFGGSIGETYGNGTTHIIRTGWKIDKGVSNDVNFRDFQPLGSLCKWERRGVSHTTSWTMDARRVSNMRTMEIALSMTAVVGPRINYQCDLSVWYRPRANLGLGSVGLHKGHDHRIHIHLDYWVCGNNVAGRSILTSRDGTALDASMARRFAFWVQSLSSCYA